MKQKIVLKIRSKKGAIPIIITAMVILLVLIVTMMQYISTDSIQFKRASKVQGDMYMLKAEVEDYYLKHGEYPVEESPLSVTPNKPGHRLIKTKDFPESARNKRDNDVYFLIDPIKLEDVVINNAVLNNLSSKYIINEKTNNIYVLGGYKLGDETVYGLPEEKKSETAREMW